MLDKLKRAIKKSKTQLIVVVILWVFLSIVFIAPMSVAIKNADVEGIFHFGTFLENLYTNMGSLFNSIFTAFSLNYIGNYFGVLLKFTVIYIIAMTIGIAKMWPKSEYDSIEHGSSDWCENGEQYKVLDPKKGILLAEKNYLPVNKRGNVDSSKKAISSKPKSVKLTTSPFSGNVANLQKVSLVFKYLNNSFE